MVRGVRSVIRGIAGHGRVRGSMRGIAVGRVRVAVVLRVRGVIRRITGHRRIRSRVRRIAISRVRVAVVV